MSQIERRRLVVHGRVQGVGFRWSCRQQALAIGVAGTVRNLRDGSVEVVAEGRPEAVEAMVTWCHQGPFGAQVTAVDSTSEPPAGLTDFAILR